MAIEGELFVNSVITSPLGNNQSLFDNLLPQLFSAADSARLIATGALRVNTSNSVRAVDRPELG